MNTATLTNTRIVRFLSALLLAAVIPFLSGCSGVHRVATAEDASSSGTAVSAADAHASHNPPSMGAVATKPLELAELFMEGPSADGDGRILLRGVDVVLSGQQALDLIAIGDAANGHQDYATQYAALLAAMYVATPAQRQTCWERYAVLFQELPLTGAAALADLIREDIELAERYGNGITSDASVAQQARRSRAANEYFTADREYQQAQGYLDDDEELIITARGRAHAAGVIHLGDSDWSFMRKIDRLLADTRGDLWEHQADAADSTFQAGRWEWRRELHSGRVRARNAIELYRRGIEPIRRPITLQ
jgi:hypothetical protein